MNRTVTQYYCTLPFLHRVYRESSRQMPAPTMDLPALLGWQQNARARLGELLGLNMMETCPLAPERYETHALNGVTLERVRIQAAPNLYIPLIVLVPQGLSPGERRPALLHSFGHGSPMRMIDALLPGGAEGASPERDAESRIGPRSLLALAKAGYLVILADSRGSGERLDFAGAKGEHVDIGMDNPMNNIATALGMSKLGMEVWDLMRMADYAVSRADCDGRIGTGGTSGGGHQSLFFAACDPRIRFTATSTWFFGFEEALIDQAHNCSCNYVPGLFTHFDAADIASLVAPRPLHVETGWRDSLSGRFSGLGNVLSQLETARESYRLYGAADRLSLWVFDGGHGCDPWDNEDRTVPQSGQMFAREVMRWLPLDEEG